MKIRDAIFKYKRERVRKLIIRKFHIPILKCFAINIKREPLTDDEKREAFVKHFIRMSSPDWTEEEIDGFYRYSKIIVDCAIKVIKANKEATKEIFDDIKRSGDEYREK